MKLEEGIKSLNNSLNNFKKAPKRRYLASTLANKLSSIKQVYNELLETIEKIESETEQKFILKFVRQLYAELYTLVTQKLEERAKLISLKNATHIIICLNKIYKKVTMTDPFNIKQATGLVPMYDGTSDNLAAFVDAATLLDELTPDAQKANAARFVRTRLTKKARLGLAENLVTIPAIIADVTNRCKSLDRPESLVAKLKQTKKKGTLTEFCDEVENLTLKLKNLYVEQRVPDAVAISMATKVGVDSLINGVTSNNLKIILQAGNFTDIKQAILKINETSTSSETAQVLMTSQQNKGRDYSSQRNNNHNNNKNNNNNHNYRNNNYSNHNNNRNGNNNNNNNNYRNNNRSNNNGNNSYRNNSNNNGYRNNNRQQNGNNNQRRVYVMNADQPTGYTPIQQAVPVQQAGYPISQQIGPAQPTYTTQNAYATPASTNFPQGNFLGQVHPR